MNGVHVGGCVTMATEQENVCCLESQFIAPHRGDKQCITKVDMFQVNVISKEGLDFGRYLYSMNIVDLAKNVCQHDIMSRLLKKC